VCLSHDDHIPAEEMRFNLG